MLFNYLIELIFVLFSECRSSPASHLRPAISHRSSCLTPPTHSPGLRESPPAFVLAPEASYRRVVLCAPPSPPIRPTTPPRLHRQFQHVELVGEDSSFISPTLLCLSCPWNTNSAACRRSCRRNTSFSDEVGYTPGATIRHRRIKIRRLLVGEPLHLPGQQTPLPRQHS